MRSILMLAAVATAGCVTYIDDSGAKRDLRVIGPDWGTAANAHLKLRGHQYRADVRRAWRGLHATLERFGLRPTHEVGEPQWQVSDTASSTRPSGAVKKLLTEARGKLDRRWTIIKARYKVSAALSSVSAERTQVAIRVFPEVYIRNEGMTYWQPLNPNGDILKALYKDLDRRMPVYRDARHGEWKDW